MEVNDYLPSHIRVLSSDSGKMEPDLVTNPFSAGLSFTSNEEQAIYQLKQENKLDEVFRILFIKQCNALNENLPALFEKTSDYTELLLIRLSSELYPELGSALSIYHNHFLIFRIHPYQSFPLMILQMHIFMIC